MPGAPLSASQLGFARRDGGAAPIVADIGIGQPLPIHKVGEAKHAELRRDGEAILVHDIRREADAAYSGEIYSFEPHHGTAFRGLNLGDRILFREEHVFSCGK